MKPESAASRPKVPDSPQHGGLRRAALLIIATAALGLAVYALAGLWGAPWLLDRWLAAQLAATPAQTAARAAIRFNPFTLTAEIIALEARNAETGTTFAAERISIVFATRSLTERRPVVSSVVIERPQLDAASLARVTAAARSARDSILEPMRIEHLELIDGAMRVGADTDRGIALSRLNLSLQTFDARAADDSAFSLEAMTATATSVRIEGTLAASLAQADGSIRLGAIDLGALAPRLGRTIAAAVPRGLLDLDGAFSARDLLGEPTLALRGARLEFSDLDLTLAAGLTVTADRLTAAGDLQLAGGAGGVDLNGRLEADQMQLAIEDTRVQPPQSFAFDDAALLADAAADAGWSLVFSGRLRQGGMTTLNLRLPPGTATRRVGIEAADLPGAVLSAYAGQALGRGLAAGTADLNLDYGLSGNRIDGSLHLSARNLEFTESAMAHDGPSLELATALLENADGIVEIDLRFASNSGNVREAVADALVARIGTVTETPFDTVAAFVDGADRTAAAVPFFPGDAALNDRALAAVAALSGVLGARPRLGLRVHGSYDAAIDRAALARQQIELHVQLATADPGTRARSAPVDFASPRVRDVLDEFAGERLPSDRVAELAERFACEGALAEVCRRAYYEQIFDALVANEEIEPRTLSRLGRFRAQSIVDALQQRGIAGGRIELVTGSDTAAVETPFGIGLPVELTALGAAPR